MMRDKHYPPRPHIPAGLVTALVVVLLVQIIGEGAWLWLQWAALDLALPWLTLALRVALFTVLGGLPSGFAIPVVCVLHLPDDRHSQLAEVLQRRLLRPVCEARDKQPLRPGQIYVAGPGYHLSVERDFTLSLSQEPPVHFSRPAIDYLFISAADAYGAGLLGVLLTGANEDGVAAARAQGEQSERALLLRRRSRHAARLRDGRRGRHRKGTATSTGRAGTALP